MRIRSLLVASAAIASLTIIATEASAQEQYLGEIVTVGFNFCPRGTAPADGQLLPISNYSALFSLYGTTYGGDGRTTFALPDLRGRTPAHQGNGPGLSDRRIGQKGGSESETLTREQLPAHTHSLNAASSDVDDSSQAAAHLGRHPGVDLFVDGGASDMEMKSESIGSTGGSQQFSVLDPYLTINYCIVIEGIYPSRS